MSSLENDCENKVQKLSKFPNLKIQYESKSYLVDIQTLDEYCEYFETLVEKEGYEPDHKNPPVIVEEKDPHYVLSFIYKNPLKKESCEYNVFRDTLFIMGKWFMKKQYLLQYWKYFHEWDPELTGKIMSHKEDWKILGLPVLNPIDPYLPSKVEQLYWLCNDSLIFNNALGKPYLRHGNFPLQHKYKKDGKWYYFPIVSFDSVLIPNCVQLYYQIGMEEKNVIQAKKHPVNNCGEKFGITLCEFLQAIYPHIKEDSDLVIWIYYECTEKQVLFCLKRVIRSSNPRATANNLFETHCLKGFRQA